MTWPKAHGSEPREAMPLFSSAIDPWVMIYASSLIDTLIDSIQLIEPLMELPPNSTSRSWRKGSKDTAKNRKFADGCLRFFCTHTPRPEGILHNPIATKSKFNVNKQHLQEGLVKHTHFATQNVPNVFWTSLSCWKVIGCEIFDKIKGLHYSRL